ncbi:hypothetical protein CK510_14030 [Brunnivagina elsteri CCALA 953]|uniref:DUF1822 domain-containing protein n=2 Tax=Brunnivagina TaxID=3344733 RepID=A0A2A2TIH0_9CYAN|nr:hypothetical protein CK510_14030 [Calothrix elsteri CCALA 953]
MNSMTNTLTFTVPLSFEAHSLAQKCRQGISNQAKAEQVYLNTLALYAVDNYLRCMGFKTDWEESDSRDNVAMIIMDVADLTVKNIGKLECRPVFADADILQIPPEVWEDRVGYVAVQLDSTLKSANILGFTRDAVAEFPLNKLQSLSDFLLYLSELEVVESRQEEKLSSIVKIGQWLEGLVDSGWENIDKLLQPQQLGLAFKQEMSVTRGQAIDLGMQLDKLSLALVVKITSEPHSEEVDILIQVHPMGEITLPEGVKLIISDESGETILEATSRDEDNWIQKEFSAELREKFKITITFGDSILTKDFEV